MTAITSLDVKQTAAALRRHLKARFPSAPISVRMSAGSAHGWLILTWTDGPTVAEVETAAAPFQSARFDGMDDAYHAIPQAGPVCYSCRGLTTQRRMSEHAAQGLADRINDADQGKPAQASGIHVEGSAVSAHAAGRLEVKNLNDEEPGQTPADVDLVAHQMFSRTTFAADSPANR